MKTTPITCPNCGASDITARGSGDFRCNHCESYFLATSAPSTSIASGPSRPQRPIAIVLSVFFGMMMAGMVAAFMLRRSTPPPSAPPPPAPPPPAFTTNSAAPPSAEIVHAIDGTTRIGGRFWLVDYRNSGDVEITSPSVAVSLFDEAGQRVGEQKGYAAIKRLQPGQTTTILVLVSHPPPYHRDALSLVQPASGFALPEVTLEVTEFRENPSFGSMRDLIGTVKNPHLRQVRFVNIIVVGRDASDQPVAFASGTATRKEIDAGGSSGFSISVGTFEVEPPKRWEVTAVGSPL